MKIDRIEKQLKHFSLIFENIADLVMLMKVEPGWRFSYFMMNQLAMSKTGFTKEVYGKTLQEVMSKERAEYISNEYIKVIQKGGTVKFKGTFISSGNEAYLGETILSPIFDQNKKCTHILALVCNITDHRKITNELTFSNQQLREKEQRLQSLVEHNLDAVWSLDKDGNFISVNPVFKKMIGKTEDELINTPFIECVEWNPEELKRNISYIKKAFQGISQEYETYISNNRGDQVYLHIKIIPTIVEDTVVGVFGISKDVTVQKKAEDALRESEEQYRLIAENSYDMIQIIELNGNTMYVSPSHEKVLGFSVEKFTSKPFTLMIHQDDVDRVKTKVITCVSIKSACRIEYRIQNRNGHYVWLEANINPIFDESDVLKHLVLVARDIRKRKEYEVKLQEMAYYDILTGLPNRRLFNDRFNKVMNQSKRDRESFALLLLDCNKFKRINDSMGHDAGDQLLKEFSERVCSSVRDIDTVSRFGGDEFVVLLPNVEGKEDVKKISKRILKALQKPWVIDGGEYKVTSSIGISMFPENGPDQDTMLKHADQALYQAKENGRNHYQFFSSTSRSAILENDLHNALARNELSLCYQPQIDLLTGQVIGVEALLRWHHPEFGWVSPAEFIPIAEKNVIITELTKWVLKTACAQNKLWHEEGFPKTKISVNISPVNFDQSGLYELITETLRETTLEPHYLELEITENAIMEDVQRTVDVLSILGKTCNHLHPINI